MASRSHEPMLNHLDRRVEGREILVQDETPISTATGRRFLEFLSFKTLPNGRQTTLPTLDRNETPKLWTPYREWAPPPFNSNENPAETAAMRFLLTFSVMDSIFDLEAILRGGFEPIQSLYSDLHFGKTRAWDGLVPISDRRWREKGLDDPENVVKACQQLSLAVETFGFFSDEPKVQQKIRNLYNKAYDHLARFDLALEAYYRQSPSQPREGGGPIPKTAHLWTEFFFTHVVFVTERAHAWVSDHVKVLNDHLLEQIRHSSPLLEPAGPTASPEQMGMLDRLWLVNQLWFLADITIFVPLQGFKNELPQWRHLSSPPTTDWEAYNPRSSLSGLYPQDYTVRRSAYSNRMKWLTRDIIVQDWMDRADREPDPTTRWSGERSHMLAVSQLKANAEAREELRGPGIERTPIHRELWVTNLKLWLEAVPDRTPGLAAPPPRHTKWGYVGYRIFYQHSADQWSAFSEAFKNDVVNWGAGVLGAADIKSKARIRWIDGRTVGIAEGDVEGARRHFRTLKENRGLDFETVDAVLIADEPSIDSYIKFTQRPLLPGQTLADEADLGPFIRVAEAKPEQSGGGTRQCAKPGSPEFDGTVRVLGSVIFDDVWANLFMDSNPLSAYWPIAAWHPNFVYTGQMTLRQIKSWREMDLVKAALFKKANEWKQEGRLGRST